MKQLVIKSGANGHNTFAIPGSDYIKHYVFAASTAVTVTIPAGAKVAIFSAADDFYTRWDGGTAVVPASDVTDGTGSELNPTVRDVSNGDSFSMIAAIGVLVSVAFYS